MNLLKHIADIAKARHPKWRVQLRESEVWLEGEAYKVKTPAREYAIGWGCLLDLASDGEWRIKKERMWVEPAYGKESGVEWLAPNAMHEKLKRSGGERACTSAIRSLRKESEFEVILPNQWLARWDAFKNKVSAWGEMPKKQNEKKLKRPQMSWEEFLNEQVRRGGEGDRALWENSYDGLTKSMPNKPASQVRHA
jgi:hypothetical protein